MSKHTPGPCQIADRYSPSAKPWLADANGSITSANGFPVFQRTLWQTVANARYACRAVNAHDDLLAACERLYAQYGECSHENETDQVVTLRVTFGAMAALAAAIAKAKGDAMVAESRSIAQRAERRAG